MFRKLIRNKKAQQTAEYALLISLVVAAVIAMQTYAQRAIQARIHDAAAYLKNETSAMGKSYQYEPYYLKSQYDVSREDTTTETQTNELVKFSKDNKRTRFRGGYQVSSYNADIVD